MCCFHQLMFPLIQISARLILSLDVIAQYVDFQLKSCNTLLEISGR